MVGVQGAVQVLVSSVVVLFNWLTQMTTGWLIVSVVCRDTTVASVIMSVVVVVVSVQKGNKQTGSLADANAAHNTARASCFSILIEKRDLLICCGYLPF